MGLLPMQIEYMQTNEQGSVYTNTSDPFRQQKQRHKIMFSVCLTHGCLSAAPLWANSAQHPLVDRVKVSDVFSDLDWPWLDMLIGYSNPLLPCQRF